jgi:hypothetical protein
MNHDWDNSNIEPPRFNWGVWFGGFLCGASTALIVTGWVVS